MSFNPDLNKQVQEVIFSKKLNKSSHSKIFLIIHQFFGANWQTNLAMYLDETLNFNLHIKEKMFKAMKGTGSIKKLSKTLPRHPLVTIFK